MQLEIITGVSFFNNEIQCVGIALAGENDSVGATKWADKVGKGGRRSSVRSTNSYKSEADLISNLKSDWNEWAEKEGLTITWKAKARSVNTPF